MASLANASNPPSNIKVRPIKKFEFWHLFAITAILLGIQSTASLAIRADIIIPFAFSALFSAISYFFLIRRMSLINSGSIFLFISVVLFVNILSYDKVYYSSYFVGPLQLIYSIFVSAAVYLIARDIRLIILQNWCLTLTFVIMALSVAELNIIVSSTFARITELLTANASLANAFDAAEMRDMAMHGSVRSKVFATEPSHAALTLMALGFGFFWTRPRFQLVIAWMAMIVICIWTIRSPILVALLLLGPALSLIIREKKGRVVRLLGGMILLLAFAFAISDYVLAIFGSRIDTGGGGDGSFDMRFTVPLQFTTDFLAGHLLYGVGIVGDFDMLTYEILAAYHERGMTYVDYNNASFSLSNNLAQHFVSFGLFFGIVALIVLVFAARMRSGWAWVIICVECLTIWMFLGGYVLARVWVLCALILAIARRAEHEDAASLRPVHIERAGIAS